MPCARTPVGIEPLILRLSQSFIIKWCREDFSKYWTNCCLTIQGRVSVTIELFMMNEMLRSDMINMEPPIYHQVFPLMWYSWSLSIAPHSTPLHSAWLSGLTTRNMLLMQQIAGAQAEAILKLQMQHGEVLTPHSMQKWATGTFKWEGEKSG